MKNKSEKNLDRVYFLTEVAYDADFFNPQAYETLIKFIAMDPAKVGIVLDGVWTRLDRPEILREKKKDGDFGLTFWGVSRKGAKAVSKHIPNQRQVRWMFGQEFKNLGLRLAELRKRLPNASIVLSVDSDDTQHSINAFLHEAELLNQYQMQGKLGELKDKRKAPITGKKTAESRLKKLQKEKAGRSELAEARKQIREAKQSLKGLDKQIVAYTHELQLYREKKTRPMTQYLRKRYMRLFRGICQRLCRQYGVKLVMRQSTLDFGKLRVDYAHSRHASWAPIKNVAKQMRDSVHGLESLITADPDHALAGVVDDLKNRRGENRPDIIACSGHFGKGWKRLQKLRNNEAEVNFKNIGLYDPDIDDDYVTLLLAMPFEDQEKIAEYTHGGKPDRMSHGKPISSKSHAVFQRNQNGSVSGLTIAWKGKDGIVETRWIQYKHFVDGTVLDQPAEYSAIYGSSDEHLGSAEEMPMVRDGLMDLFRNEALTASSFWGKPLFARGFISGGDTGEANSDKWPDRYHEKRDPTVIRDEVTRRLASLDTKNIDAMRAAVLQHLNDAMGGSVESMRDIQKRVRNYYSGPLEISLEHSSLQIVHASVPGNHADNVFRRLGIRETDLFVEHCAAKGIGIYESGMSTPIGTDPWYGVRVAVGGYSVARTLLIGRYGLGMDGKPLFGPIRFLMHHDPKGSDHRGLVGSARSAHSDVAVAGHTHENEVVAYGTGPNTFRIAYRMATMQGETATGIMYAESVPRTPAGHRMIMPRPGDFSERAIPASFLQKKGREAFDRKITEAIATAK